MKRLVRYLKRESQCGQVFSSDRKVEDVRTYFDSACAECKETPTSPSAGVTLIGRHTLNSYTRKQTIMARSSAEAELDEAELDASESKRIVSLLCDMGNEMKSVLAFVAKATEHILHRQGIGRLKHIDMAYLWTQDEVRSKMLRTRIVKSEQTSAPNHSAKR